VKAGGDVVHTQADPSRTELARKDFEKKREAADLQKKKEIADRYGSAASEDAPEERALRDARATSERYVEYGADGRVIKGAPVASRQSRYVEDVHESGHDCVWGSYFCPATFRWGYADDHSTTRHSYATGEAGKRANDAAVLRMTAPVERELANAPSSNTQPPPSRASLYGEADGATKLDEAKVKEAMARRKAEEGDGKRKYNSFATSEVTPEEMEAYRRTKVAKDDPMAKFLGE
jgi:pre-mRNA-processing factor SLU7